MWPDVLYQRSMHVLLINTSHASHGGWDLICLNMGSSDKMPYTAAVWNDQVLLNIPFNACFQTLPGDVKLVFNVDKINSLIALYFSYLWFVKKKKVYEMHRENYYIYLATFIKRKLA